MHQKRPITFDMLIVSRLWGVFMYEVNLSEKKERMLPTLHLETKAKQQALYLNLIRAKNC